MLVSDAAYRALEPVLLPAAAGMPIYICDAPDFIGITGHDIHRGCLALVERPPARSVDDLLVGMAQRSSAATAIAGLPCATLVALEGITNADNVGGVFRNAAAFGADAVLLNPTCCDPLYRKAIRTSMAATIRVPYARTERWPGDLDQLRAHGFVIVALTPREPSITLDELAQRPRPPKIAWLVGTEGEGSRRTRSRSPIAASASRLRRRSIPSTLRSPSGSRCTACGHSTPSMVAGYQRRLPRNHESTKWHFGQIGSSSCFRVFASSWPKTQEALRVADLLHHACAIPVTR